MGSVLIELQDPMLTGLAVFGKETLDALLQSDVPVRLAAIAKEQQQLRPA